MLRGAILISFCELFKAHHVLSNEISRFTYDYLDAKQATKVTRGHWSYLIWSRVSSPIWRRRRIEGQITPRRGWWACVLWGKFRSQYKRSVSVSWWAVLVVGLVTMVTVLHAARQTIKEGEFRSPFCVFGPLPLLFHSSILEPSLHLCCGT